MNNRSFNAGPTVAAVCVTILAAIALPTQAQVLEEIIVTAQKREQNLQEVPVSITAFSGDQLRSLRITNTDDVVDFTPGLTMFSPLGEGNTPNFSLRGVSGSDISGLTEAPIAVYTDEIYYGTQFGAISQIYDMERYEALRGPQGTLFGRNATGGLLHFVTQKPTIGETTGYVDLTLGSYNETTFEGAFNLALGDAWAVRLSGAMEQYDGYVENRFPGQPDPNDTDKIAARFQIAYQGDRSRLNVNLHTAKDDSRVGSWQIVGAEVFDAGGNVIVPAQNDSGQTVVAGDGQSLLFDPVDVDPVTTVLNNPLNLMGPAYTTYAEGIAIQGIGTRRAPEIPINFGLFGGPYIDDDGDPFAGEYNYISDLTLENTGAWVRYEFDISDSMTFIALGGFEEFSQVYLEDTDLSPVDDIRVFFGGENEQSSLELRLEGSTDLMSSYVLGAYYYERDVIDDAGPNVVLPTLMENVGINPPAQSDDDANTESIAIFGQVDFALTDRLTLTAGLRFTDEETTVTSGTGNVDFCLFANVDQATCAAARQNTFLNGVPLADQGVIIDFQTWHMTLPSATNSFAPVSPQPMGPPLTYVDSNYTQSTNSLSDEFSTGVLKLAYSLGENSMVYGSFSQGSKSGGFNTNPDAIAILGTDSFSREQLNSIEFGYRSEFADGRARFNATVFDYDYKDYQATQFLAPGVSGTINTDAEITGAELEVWWAPADKWTIFLSSAMLFDTSVNNIRDTLGIVKTREMKQAPDLQINGFVEYTTEAFGGNLSAQLNYVYSSEYFSFLNNLGGGLVPSYDKLGANATWVSDSEKWYLRLNVTNLTDEEILISAFDFSTSGAYVQELYLPPRWVSLSFGINF
jgi:iron complex outermembrane receptor protein